MNKNKLVLPISILLGCIVLGGFYYATETSKQKSVEKQRQAELLAKEESDQLLQYQAKIEQGMLQQSIKTNYNDCLETARENYLASWANSCKDSYTAYIQCYEKFGDIRDYCRQSYGGWQNSNLCTLVSGTATVLNNSYESEKNRCAMVYGQK